ncbi:MAG: transcription-repair coupling factor [Deltaproteobacteria bacterium]|nr:transcription-repair coupling factor [Deltaproteobacteria bacterium]MBT7891989.1 transcription-repair coupling factor [Deltaproteobacteria bacterium]
MAVNGVIKSRQQEVALSSLSGSAGALLIAQLSGKTGLPFLIIAESYELAERIKLDFEFFSDPGQVSFFPHWDTIPYDNQSPDKDVVAIRFQALESILYQKASVIITTPNALMQRIMLPEMLQHNSFDLNVSESIEREGLLARLVDLGFVRVDMVEEKGEFAVRGELIDIFPITESDPVRLDFFDDELESIKYFDVETQRSIRDVSTIRIVPAQEVIFSAAGADEILKRLLPYKFESVPQTYNYIVEQIESGASFSGMENLLPLFYEKSGTLLDYFPVQPGIVFFDKSSIVARSEHFFNEILTEYEYSRQEGNPTLGPESLFLSTELLLSELKPYRWVDIQSLNLDGQDGEFELSTVDNTALQSLSISPEKVDQGTASNVIRQLKEWNLSGAKVAIAVGSQSKADRVRQMLDDIDLSVTVIEESTPQMRRDFLMDAYSPQEASFYIIPLSISSGFRWVDNRGRTRTALISDEEIFGSRQKQRRIRKPGLKKFFSSLGDLNAGDYVVHVEYGIGRYEGLKKITADQNEADYLVIVYLGGDKVYVPVDKFHLVQKYTGGEGSGARLSKLGSKTWLKTKSKIGSEIDDMAEELVRINAERQAKKGVAFSQDGSLMNEFTLTFPFQETEDQEGAIKEVLQDMEMEKPMDRLVCGDVGFGKTEVAMRAAYKAVIDSYQVGILVPTTILAQQHFDSFSRRFADTPVKIGMLSRFRSPKQIKEVLTELKEGRLDIVIGTHRLLSKDVVFKQLGLLVIDEEQRFGVKHKETVKKLRTTVDTLILSATPIPRTLHMSMVGIRDISVINTPPMDRRAIRTRLLKFNDYVIQEAVNREIRRKGQVFFIHNRVESIYEMGQYLSGILPQARIAVAHGQMPEKNLEQVMLDFIKGDFDVLLSTTIVESGLDIPNVNTIVINNADHFGLSQLYQLRGRVGRSNLQAYSYLMTPREKILSETARKRLSILQELNHLGAGFKIANFDLELRGAGNVLGAKQSGHIAAVGFELYTSMIEDAVAKIREGESRRKPVNEIKLNLVIEAGLPDTYIDSMNQRLDAYKTISACENEATLWDVRSALEDRFGSPPQEAVNLFYSMQIKLLATDLLIIQLNQSYETIEMVFSDDFQPDPVSVLNFMKNSSYQPQILPNNIIRVKLTDAGPEQILSFLQSFRKELSFNEQAESMAASNG